MASLVNRARPHQSCMLYLISRFASDAGKKAGEFYTPAAVSKLLSRLAASQAGNTIPMR